MEFIFSDYIFRFWCIENNEMVNKVNINPIKSYRCFFPLRSTEEIFALFVSIAFLVDASTHVYKSKIYSMIKSIFRYLSSRFFINIFNGCM